MTRGGLPHSDIPGSKLVCSSPGLFAACHVLHRLLAPRHSPYTLSSLTIRNSKLTLTNRLHISWSATVPCNTACPFARLRISRCYGALRRDECCGRKKLPCAEYSVVKDQAYSTCRSESVNVGWVWRATGAALNKPSPDVGVRETQRPHSLTETLFAVALRVTGETGTNLRCRFKNETLNSLTCRTSRAGLPTVARSASR